MKKNIKIVEWIVDISLLIVLSFIYFLNQPMFSPKVIYIPQGSVSKIITHLDDKGLDISTLDTLMLRFIGSPQHGWIDLKDNKLTHYDFLYKISNSKAALKNITLIPGETSYIFLQQSAKELNLSFTKLYKAYQKYTPFKEGALVPDTYSVPYGITERALIKLLLKSSQIQMKRWSIKIFGVYEKNKWFQYVTMASIIQKESADINDMTKVSSVIHNRLKEGMKLQMDGSLNYGKYSHIKITSKRIRNDKSRYNTYKYAGLPPAPICNVSFEAIKAAIFPLNTPYLYFVRDKKGHHKYTRYFSTHKKNVYNATKRNK